jgi:hypothetical protein
MLEKVKRRGSWQRKRKKIGRRDETKYSVAFMYTLCTYFCARIYTCHSRVRMVHGIWGMLGVTDL